MGFIYGSSQCRHLLVVFMLWRSVIFLPYRKGKFLSCVSHANVVYGDCCITSFFLLLYPMRNWVLSYITYVFQLLSALFWIFGIQFDNVKVSFIQHLRQYYEMSVSVFEVRLVVCVCVCVYIYIYTYVYISYRRFCNSNGDFSWT